MEKHTAKLNWISIVSWISTIITVVIFFTRGFGNMAIANDKLEQVVEWKWVHIEEHKEVADDISTMKWDIKWIRDLLDKKF